MLWVCLGAVSIAPRMFGYNFLPSTEWVAMANGAGLLSGVVSAGLMPWALHSAQDSTLKRVLNLLAGSFIGYICGKDAVLITAPMILALVAGHSVELPYTVARSEEFSSKCPSPLVLEDLPLIFDRICDFPDESRLRVARGDRIAIVGHGTDFGIFVDNLRLSD